MSHLFSIVLLAASANIDNLGVGLAYGVVRRRIPLMTNVLIALVSGFGTLSSMAAGEWVNDLLAENVAEVLGGGLMVAIGVVTAALAVRAAVGRPLAHRPVADGAARVLPVASVVGAREAAALALSLTLNNLAVGLGAGVSHVPIAWTTALTMVASIAAIAGGGLVGRRLPLTISRHWLGVVSGLMIVAVGIYECVV